MFKGGVILSHFLWDDWTWRESFLLVLALVENLAEALTG